MVAELVHMMVGQKEVRMGLTKVEHSADMMVHQKVLYLGLKLAKQKET